MTIVLIDNGSLAAAAHRQLRATAAALAEEIGVPVQAVSWRHSDRVPAADLEGSPAETLAPWLRTQLARGEREFLFVPFFVSVDGAIGSALRRDLALLQREAGDFTFTFSGGLAEGGVLGEILAERIRETIATLGLRRPAVIVVDHGGPSAESAALRNRIAAEVQTRLGPAVRTLAAASMEGEAHAHNRPLLAEALAAPDCAGGDVVIAPLFLAPGRHAGADGDLAHLARTAEALAPAPRCHFTALVGSHPRVVAALALALRARLARCPTPVHP